MQICMLRGSQAVPTPLCSADFPAWLWTCHWNTCHINALLSALCLAGAALSIPSTSGPPRAQPAVPCSWANQLKVVQSRWGELKPPPMAQWIPFPAQRVSPLTHSTQRGAPDLAGLLLNGIHSALHRTQQGPDLAGCLLEQEACHKLIHAAATFVHLWRRTEVGASLEPWDHGRAVNSEQRHSASRPTRAAQVLSHHSQEQDKCWGMRAEVSCLVPLMGSLRAKASVTEMSKEDGVGDGDSGSDDGFSGDDGDRSDSNNGVSGVTF